MKIALALIAACSALALTAVPTFASDSGSVAARVNVAEPCIIVTGVAPSGGQTSTLDYGTLALSTSSSTVENTQYANYSDCSGSPETIFVKGTDALGGSSTWNLVPDGNPCSAGVDKYGVRVTGGQNTISTRLTLTDQQFLAGFTSSSPTGANVTLIMPCTGSSGRGQPMTFSVTFTATF